MVLSFKKAYLAALQEVKSDPAVTKLSATVTPAASLSYLDPQQLPVNGPGAVKLPPTQQLKAVRQSNSAVSSLTSPKVSTYKFKAQTASRLAFQGTPTVAWHPEDTSRLQPIDRETSAGVRLMPMGGTPQASRELVMGLDFGTSCTKVVIADREMKHAYAVPLVDATGVNCYLLPARLSQSRGEYTLADKGKAFTDLKLSLLASPMDEAVCARVCAFLALVIRSARAWLFTEHRDKYLNADILWTLALGQPADQATSQENKDLYMSLAKVAWFLAGQSGRLTTASVLETWRSRVGINLGDELEIMVMPELAAQIHGFVSSSHFDARGSKIFLMVDVGAGTVDASTFYVKKDASGTASFSLFTNSVEAYGVANLHRYRVGWWQSQLRVKDGGQAVADELEAIRLPTEYRGRFPDSFRSYLHGVSVHFSVGEKTPDEKFFDGVIHQVRGKVLYRAHKDNLLPKESIQGIPLFLCGGGSRHPFFSRIEDELKRKLGCTWLYAQRRDLVLPTGLIAPGVSRTEYDRLSVAFGLSQLTIGSFKQAEKLIPVVPVERASDWTSNYVDKSAC